MAAGKAAATAPLRAGWVWTGSDTYNITTASGQCYDIDGGVIGGGPSGGILPYVVEDLDWVTSDGGHTFIVGSHDNIHNTIGWGGMNVGDYAFGHWEGTVTDSGGQTDTFRFPAAGEMLFHRVS